MSNHTRSPSASNESGVFPPQSDSGSSTVFERADSTTDPLLKDENIKTLLSSFTPSTNSLSSFYVLPKDVRFHTQEEKEKIILLLRRHPATNIPWIILSIILMLVPFIGLPVINIGGIVQYFNRISAGLIPALIAFWYLIVLGYIFLNFFFWYFNVNIITTRRVMDFDFLFLLYREFSEALLDKIEDVTATGGGIFSAIFNYGDVAIQTAGARVNIEFLKVPRPQQVVQIITSLVEAREKVF